MSKQHVVRLTDAERTELAALLRRDDPPGFALTRARILLHADVGGGRPYQTDLAVATATAVDPRTVARVRAQFAREGLAATLVRRPSARRPRPLEPAPAGRTSGRTGDRGWDRARDRAPNAQKNELKPWKTQRFCIPPEANAAFVAAMEDGRAVYARPPDPARPLVCLDEAATGLQADVRAATGPRPGVPARVDYEYARHGGAPYFLTCAPHLGWRRVAVTERRTALDFARAIKRLVDEDFPAAERIVLVLDNLNTHTAGALYRAFPPAEARRLWDKLEVHYTPKHGSWLNIAELELAVLARQCLPRRIPDRPALAAELDAWAGARNATRTPTAWRFSLDDARTHLAHLYPIPTTGQ